jgi:hypothetical protein
MVKLIIDFLGSALSDEILSLTNTILLIPPTCHLPEDSNHKYKELKDLDSQLHQGNFIFRTSDDCLRGLVLGKLTEKFPKLLIYSSRPEVLLKYLPDAKIESWPNTFESYLKIEGSTLVGPPALNEFSEVPSPQVALPLQVRNEPKAPQRSSTSEGLSGSRILNPQSFNSQPKGHYGSSNPLASNSPGIQADSSKMVKNQGLSSNSYYIQTPDAKPNTISSSFNNTGQLKPSNFSSGNQGFPGILKSKPQESIPEDIWSEAEPKMSEESIKEYLQTVFIKFIDYPEMSSVTSYKDLHLLVQRIIRELGEKDEKLIENDLDRFKIQNEACFKILEFGFYKHNSGYSYRELVDKKLYGTPLYYSYS